MAIPKMAALFFKSLCIKPVLPKLPADILLMYNNKGAEVNRWFSFIGRAEVLL